MSYFRRESGPLKPDKEHLSDFPIISAARSGQLLAGLKIHVIIAAIAIFHDLIRLCLNCMLVKAKASNDKIKGCRVGSTHHVADCVTKPERELALRLTSLCGRDNVSEGKCAPVNISGEKRVDK